MKAYPEANAVVRSFGKLLARGTDTSAGCVTVAGRPEAERRIPNGG